MKLSLQTVNSSCQRSNLLKGWYIMMGIVIGNGREAQMIFNFNQVQKQVYAIQAMFQGRRSGKVKSMQHQIHGEIHFEGLVIFTYNQGFATHNPSNTPSHGFTGSFAIHSQGFHKSFFSRLPPLQLQIIKISRPHSFKTIILEPTLKPITYLPLLYSSFHLLMQ